MTKKLQQNLLALGMMLVMLGFVYYKYLMSPLKIKHNDALQRLQTIETKLADMRMRAMELPKLQAEMKQLEQEVTELEKLLPKDKEVPDLLRTVTKTASKYRMKIVSFAPAGVSAQGGYNEILFQVSMQGSYHALAHFLAELGQESRILTARNITFKDNPSAKASDFTVTVNFTLVAYTFKG